MRAHLLARVHSTTTESWIQLSLGGGNGFFYDSYDIVPTLRQGFLGGAMNRRNSRNDSDEIGLREAKNRAIVLPQG
eukprot:IDg16819t1